MFKEKVRQFAVLICLILAGSICRAGGLDPAKYITIDEVVPGMEAYCLTTYKGTEVEKFDLEVLSIVRNFTPGRDAILVQGTDERFIHTGPVAGCSGSPVYIDGRLAGALAFAWTFSKDPLYGVTPIEEMLRVGGTEDRGPSFAKATEGKRRGPGYVFDFSKPIDFDEVSRKMTDSKKAWRGGTGLYAKGGLGAAILPCPLITSGLPADVCERLNELVEPFGLMAVAGLGGGVSVGRDEDVRLEPGACLVVPLVTGDIQMEVIGTVTEVIGNDVYGFGHSFLGFGPVDLPMATGQVHTVVSRMYRSFKLASSLEIVGALRTDESAAVLGRIGAKAKMIPLTIKVERYNDPEGRVYNCQVVSNRLLTPDVFGSAVAGAVFMLGSLPPDHTIEYKVAIDVGGVGPRRQRARIAFENVSTSVGIADMMRESVGSVAMLLNNPYREVDIKSIDFDIRIAAKDTVSRIWSVDLSDSRVKAGEQIDVSVVVESVLAPKKKYRCTLKIPESTAPGRYKLIVSGGYSYRRFLRQNAPYKFIPQNLTSLIEAMNNLLAIRRDRLYCVLVLPAEGVTVEKAELPDLPATKALILGDAKRALRPKPYRHWLEETVETDTVIIDKEVMYIIVEE